MIRSGQASRLGRVPNGLVNRTLGSASERIPGLRRLPVLKLLSAAEIALLAHEHVARLTPTERRRLVGLIRAGRGRPSHLDETQRDELARLVAMLAPRELFGETVDRLSPVPLPRRVLFGHSKTPSA